MKTAKKTAEYTIFRRKDDRYAIRGKNGKWINGDAKVEILVAQGLVKKPEPKPQPEPEAPAEEAPAEDSTQA